MYIPERVKYFRMKRGLTQKRFGILLGFPEKTADIRVAQYERARRKPKNDILHKMANVLGISPNALNIPDIRTEEGLMHTLFLLEDMYGLEVRKFRGEVVLYPTTPNSTLSRLLQEWYEHTYELHNRHASRNDYDKWRYNYE